MVTNIHTQTTYKKIKEFLRIFNLLVVISIKDNAFIYKLKN